MRSLLWLIAAATAELGHSHGVLEDCAAGFHDDIFMEVARVSPGGEWHDTSCFELCDRAHAFALSSLEDAALDEVSAWLSLFRRRLLEVFGEAPTCVKASIQRYLRCAAGLEETAD